MASFIKKGWWMIKTFKNPISILLFNQGHSNNCTFKFRDPKIKNLYLTNDYRELALFLTYWRSKESFSDEFIKFINKFDINNEFFEYDGLICKCEPSSWVFVESDDYFDKFLIKNRTVIDIGGNVGDTALKFAKRGAIVYAFEPEPHIYETAIENINLNPKYKNKIHFYNKAISHKRSELIFFKDNLNSGGHSQVQTDKNNEKIIIDSITIDDVIKDFNIKPDILKMDCEGCEYNIILNCNLNMFNDIILEYHQALMKKPYTILVDELKKQGFNVKIFYDNPKDEIGIIYAYKSHVN